MNKSKKPKPKHNFYKEGNVIYLNDNAYVGSQNIKQSLNYFAERYKISSKVMRDSLKSYFENTYMSKIIEQLDSEIKEERKRIRQYKNCNIKSDSHLELED